MGNADGSEVGMRSEGPSRARHGPLLGASGPLLGASGPLLGAAGAAAAAHARPAYCTGCVRFQ